MSRPAAPGLLQPFVQVAHPGFDRAWIVNRPMSTNGPADSVAIISAFR